MEKIEKPMRRYGLVGKNIDYSFSRQYFNDKFKKLQLSECSYDNFDIASIDDFPAIVKNTPNLMGLNVTIPYKEEVIPFLQGLGESAKKIGAVNTIKPTKKGLMGYNTDAYGFQKSLEPFLKKYHKKALILGTGGASKAVAFVLQNLGIGYTFVSRTGNNNGYRYDDLNEEIMMEHLVIINCSPVGTYPDSSKKPSIPYDSIGSRHLLFDLIYNPAKTAFLKEGESRGAAISNGLRMLELQAEKAWDIWNS